MADLTPQQCANWLVEYATGGGKGKMASSLGVARSAISTRWELAGLEGANPASSPIVSRLLKGYAKSRVEAEAVIRSEREETISLTVERLAELAPIADCSRGGAPRDVMLWAAACVATFGLNRCAELFGATRVGRPPIAASAVKFFDSEYATQPRALCPGPAEGAPLPAYFTLALGPTKADPMGRNADLRIAARVAVAALWKWMHLRRDRGGTLTGHLFQVDSFPPLTRTELFERVRDWHRVAFGTAPKVTGRAFRRGGNQSLVASGAPHPVLKQAGRWKSDAMPSVYSSAEADAARGLKASRALGDLYEAAAAARQR